MHSRPQGLYQLLSRLCNLPANNNHARIYQMHNVCQGDSQTRLDLLNDTLRNFVTLSRQAEYLFRRNTLGAGSRNAPGSDFSLRMLCRTPGHRLRDRLRGRNCFKVTVATARTLWPVLFDKHVPNFTCRACRTMVNLAIDH